MILSATTTTTTLTYSYDLAANRPVPDRLSTGITLLTTSAVARVGTIKSVAP